MRRAGRNLKQSKGRTLLTSLAIAVGAFTLTLSLAVGEGARKYADTLIRSNVDPQSLYVTKEKIKNNNRSNAGLKEYSDNAIEYSGVTYKTLSQKDIEKVQALDGVDSVRPMYVVSAQYVTFEGISKKYSTDITTYNPTVLASVAAGSLPELGKDINKHEAVVPESFADTLGLSSQDLVGKTVTLHLTKAGPRPSDEAIQEAFLSGGSEAVSKLAATETRELSYMIRAVSAKSSTSFSASTALFISDPAAKEASEFLTKGTSRYQQYVAAVAQADIGVNTEKVKAEVQKLNLSALTAVDLQNTIFTIVNLLQGIVTGFGLLALFASVFGIINTQYISVLERTSQIGLMKALGMPRRAISKLFRYEAAWIGLIGGTIGTTVAIVLGLALNPWINATLSLDKGTNLLIFVWWQVLALMFVLILVAILAGWLPARKASRLDPIEALRTE
jgi:putative ABC transport system permease protein